MPLYVRHPLKESVGLTADKTHQPSYDYLFKLVIIGQSGTGKSCLLRRYCENSFSDSFISTIGVDFQSKQIPVGNNICNLQIWDTSGQERFRTITSSYYRGSKGVVIVYDCQDANSIKELDYWLSQAKRYVGEDTPILIVGNKIDLPSQVPAQEVQKFAVNHGCLFVETSAKTGINVDEAFQQLASACLAKVGVTHQFKQHGTIDLDNKDSTAANGLCCWH